MVHEPRPAEDVVGSTLRALVLPRRLVPILAIGIPIIFAQSRGPSPYAVPVGAAMVLAFVLIAPVAYRRLFTGPQTESFALRLVTYVLIATFVIGMLGVVLPRGLDMRATFLTYDTSLFISLGLFLVGGYGLGRDIESERALALAEARAATLVREAEHAQLLAIKSHLDPHFLFNTLNAIAEWCRDDGVAAEQAILELASMLRTVLDGLRTPSWPLARDVELSRALGRLYAARDPLRFVFEADIDAAALDRDVPAMITLPLIENAWKHGPSKGHDQPVRLRVRARAAETVIEVENGGAFSGAREGGEGLVMVKRRLDAAFAGRARFVIAAVGDTTVATLTLPYEGEGV